MSETNSLEIKSTTETAKAAKTSGKHDAESRKKQKYIDPKTVAEEWARVPKPYYTSDEQLADYFKLIEIMLEADRYGGSRASADKRTEALDLYDIILSRTAASHGGQAELGLERLRGKHNLDEKEILIAAACAYGHLFPSRRTSGIAELLRAINCGNLASMLDDRKKYFGTDSKLIKKRIISIEGNGKDIYMSSDSAAALMGTEPAFLKHGASRRAFRPKILSAAEIYERLGEYVVGQDRAKRMIASAAAQHLARVRMKPRGGSVGKSNVLLLGPTGCGKTHICRSLAKILGVPVVVADATSYSETGYVGDNVENMVALLWKEARGDARKAESGIIFIDEIDKIAARNATSGHYGTRDVSGECVQQELLKLLEGRKISTQPRGIFETSSTFNTEKVLFIAGGAFSGLEKITEGRRARKSSGGAIGFGANSGGGYETGEARPSAAITSDLVEYGMIPELLGRLPVVCRLEALGKEHLASIVEGPKESITAEYNNLLAAHGIEIKLSPGAAEAAAEAAMKHGTGARGLRSVFEEIVAGLLMENRRPEDGGRRVVEISAADIIRASGAAAQ